MVTGLGTAPSLTVMTRPDRTTAATPAGTRQTTQMRMNQRKMNLMRQMDRKMEEPVAHRVSIYENTFSF